MRALAAIALLLAACAGPTSPTPTLEHAEVISEQWAIAQGALGRAFPLANKVKSSRFQWIAHNGKYYDCGYAEGVNGCFDPGDLAIHWNVQTPGVIQHEAAHAILKVLGIHCWRYVSLDSGKLTFHKISAERSKKVDEIEFCERWFALHFGGN